MWTKSCLSISVQVFGHHPIDYADQSLWLKWLLWFHHMAHESFSQSRSDEKGPPHALLYYIHYCSNRGAKNVHSKKNFEPHVGHKEKKNCCNSAEMYVRREEETSSMFKVRGTEFKTNKTIRTGRAGQAFTDGVWWRGSFKQCWCLTTKLHEKRRWIWLFCMSLILEKGD